ncbi:hypothetical protein AX769_14010 [Frondihabitans sp. PAMC 28766]|nr:hypothetical protein AX769_14010 [Frondihabitans sp. PAMC 28766]
MAWQTPASVSVSPDRSSYESIGFTDAGPSAGGTGVVQFTIGLDVRLVLVTEGGPVEIRGQDATGHVVHGVIAVVRAPSAAPRVGAEGDDTERPAAPPEPAASEPPPAPAEPDLTNEPLPSRELVAEVQPDLDETVLTPVGLAPDEAAAAIRAVADFDATIVGGGELQGAPAVGDSPGAASRAPRILRVVVTDTNGPRTVEIDGDVFVGRAPRLPAERAVDDGALVVVASRTAHVSATHLQLTRADGRVLGRDLWSTNGTMLAPPTGAPYRLEPGEILPLIAGTRLVLADDVTVDLPTDPLDASKPADAANPSRDGDGEGQRAQ